MDRRHEDGIMAITSANSTRETHGLARDAGGKITPLYSAWINMRQRCSNFKAPGWKNYGGRGINVCDRWNSFTVFAADVGPHPGRGWSLDRIDNDGDYEPNNIRWANRKTQNRNSRRAKLTMTDAKEIRRLYGDWKWQGKPRNKIRQYQLAELFGVDHTTISDVLSGKIWS